MDILGYRLASNSQIAEAGYIPSLTGADPVNLNGRDVYFASIDITVGEVTSIARTRWLTPDNDHIVGVKLVGGVTFYIPFHDLRAAAVANERYDISEMLGALLYKRPTL